MSWAAGQPKCHSLHGCEEWLYLHCIAEIRAYRVEILSSAEPFFCLFVAFAT